MMAAAGGIAIVTGCVSCGLSRPSGSSAASRTLRPAGWRPAPLDAAAPALFKRKSRATLQVAFKPLVMAAATVEGDEAVTALKFGPGSKVRVKADVTVYHISKWGKEAKIQGWEGVVAANAAEHKGRAVSATFPYKVEFVRDVAGKSVKGFVHLVESELELV
eukprot:jgi/Chlat1/2561/Chrsp175S02411